MSGGLAGAEGVNTSVLRRAGERAEITCRRDSRRPELTITHAPQP
jgi:hypothetical protein